MTRSKWYRWANCWYSGSKRDLWIEYKFITIPKRTGKIDLIGGKNPPLSHLQQNWLKLRFKEGRNVAVIVGSKDGGVFMDLLEWTEPWTPDEFKSMLKTRKELAEIIQRRTLITP